MLASRPGHAARLGVQLKPNAELIQQILRADNYREFILVFLGANKKRVNFADLARKMNFSSRAYVSDMMNGHKPMTANAFPRFVTALKLTGLMNQLFQLLVLKEEKHLPRDKSLTNEKILEKIGEIKTKLRDKYLNPGFQSDLQFISYDVFTVYAALGSQAKGASISEILQRTQIAEQNVASILNSLMGANFVIKKGERFFASNINFDVKNLGNNLGFKQAFVHATHLMTKKAAQMEEHPEDLFFHTAFSVQKNKVPEMRERLQELLYEYLDSEQDEDGDSIQKLTLAFYH